ncbi:hypothetical protein AO370_1766 [Moraxella catarrhalis]|uniref:Uncharacterized protein n=1 Tax=Moraxella catarrhalis TaxID=480 RepID=A0AB36DLC6_MORCA|nr:hypothetical protein AO370_1766 [Moraxella catarrhalis]
MVNRQNTQNMTRPSQINPCVMSKVFVLINKIPPKSLGEFLWLMVVDGGLNKSSHH